MPADHHQELPIRFDLFRFRDYRFICGTSKLILSFEALDSLRIIEADPQLRDPLLAAEHRG